LLPGFVVKKDKPLDVLIIKEARKKQANYMRHNGMKSISVIIPTYYRYEYLAEVLELLTEQTVTPYEVIIPDQTPERDRPEAFYKRYSEKLNLKVIDIEKPSLTYPRNMAAKKATGDILIFLDDDIVFNTDFIEKHVAVMEEENVDVVNGATTRRDALPEEYPWDINHLDPVRYFLSAPNWKWNGMMFSISSCNVSMKKSVFDEADGFDEKLPRMVDFEFGYRLYQRGAKIYFSSKPWAKHLRAEGGSRKNPQNYDKLISSLYIHKKHFPGWTTKQFMIKCIMSKKTIINPISIFKVYCASRKADQLLKGSSTV